MAQQSTRAPRIPTMRQRLDAIRRAAILIEAALVAADSDPEDHAHVSRDYLEAARALISEVHEHAFWVLELPAVHLNVPAPDQDQRERLADGAR